MRVPGYYFKQNSIVIWVSNIANLQLLQKQGLSVVCVGRCVFDVTTDIGPNEINFNSLRCILQMI